MSVDLSAAHIRVQFDEHPNYPNAQKTLNAAYGVALTDLTALFQDPTNKVDLVDDAKDVLRQLIIDDFVSAADPQDRSAVEHVIDRASSRICWKDGAAGHRLTKQSIYDAMKKAAQDANGDQTCVVIFNILPFHFPDGITYLDWSKFTIAPTGTLSSQAAAAQAPAQLTVQDLATSLQSLVTTLSANAAGPSGTANVSVTNAGGTTAAGTGQQPQSRRQSQYLFNPSALPPDVRESYDNKCNGKVITKSMVEGPYQFNQLRYHLDGPDRLFLKDGSLFLLDSEEPSEKEFLRDVIPCKDESHAGVRQWYDAFAKHCMDHGYYAHPLYCFRKDHGGQWGFTFGASNEDDLPQRLKIPVAKMSGAIYRALMKKDTFPANSKLRDFLTQSYSDGYKALKLILYASHPAFHEQPTTLITRYPTQQSESIVEYHSIFVDYLQQRAFIQDIPASLDQSGELDVFITGAKYGTFLNRVTRDERTRDSLKHKYTADQIVETLLTFLRAPDSPLVLEEQNRVPRVSPPPRTASLVNNSRTPARDVPRTGRRASTTLNAITSSNLEQIVLDVHAIQVPDDADSQQLHRTYTGAVYQIMASPDAARNSPCIVCGGDHRFEQCSVLQNTEFLRKHYIRYCQHLRRDADSRAAAFNGPAGTIPGVANRQSHVNLVDVETVDDTLSEGDEAPDFQTGRV